MSQTLGELEAEGLISRSPDESDGRRTKVSLTPIGRDGLVAERARRDGWLGQAIGEFTDEERELIADAIPLLGRLSAHR